jgi:hypothetical protein
MGMFCFLSPSKIIERREKESPRLTSKVKIPPVEWYAPIWIRSMNAQLLRRLFKAINEGPPALNRVASEILDEQRRRGHGRLATQLEAVLKEHTADAATRATQPHAGAVVHELRPLSQRQELMATITRPELLQHHMVLASAVE